MRPHLGYLTVLEDDDAIAVAAADGDAWSSNNDADLNGAIDNQQDTCERRTRSLHKAFSSCLYFSGIPALQPPHCAPRAHRTVERRWATEIAVLPVATSLRDPRIPASAENRHPADAKQPGVSRAVPGAERRSTAKANAMLRTRLRVQCRCGLVAEQQAGVPQDRPGNRLRV